MSANKITTEQRQGIFLEALKKNLFVVTAACEQTGIGRTTYYDWMREDPEFRKKVEEVGEIQIDFVETQLLKKIKEGDGQSIIFYLKTKGRKKGYVENVDVTTNGKDITEIKLIRVEKPDNNLESE